MVTVDVSILDGQDGYLTGTAKLAQRFLIELMTERGSLDYQPTRGTDFARATRQRLFSSERDVIVWFQASMVDLSATLKADEPADAPDDERFGSAVLSQVTLLAGALGLDIVLVPRGGGTSVRLEYTVRY